MNKAERDLRIDEAIEWMCEDGFLPDVMGKKAAGTLAKFPGWVFDEKVVRALLEAAVLGHPEIQLIPCLANMRANWIHLGPASARAWAVRWRNWIKNEWDPLVAGHPRQDSGQLAAGSWQEDRKPVPNAMRHAPCAQPPGNDELRRTELAKVKDKLG